MTESIDNEKIMAIVEKYMVFAKIMDEKADTLIDLELPQVFREVIASQLIIAMSDQRNEAIHGKDLLAIIDNLRLNTPKPFTLYEASLMTAQMQLALAVPINARQNGPMVRRIIQSIDVKLLEVSPGLSTFLDDSIGIDGRLTEAEEDYLITQVRAFKHAQCPCHDPNKTPQQDH